MTARAPVYIDSGKLHVFEDGDTLPPWLSPSSMAWANLTGVPAGITQLAALTGPGYAKVDAAGAWSVRAAIPQADVSGLATALAGLQPISARLAAIAGLTDAAGWLHDDGSGNWALTTPTKSDVGLSLVENTALSTWGGSTSLTTLGTVASGIWHGTAIADSYIASAATWNAKEGGLGNPSVSGQVLASTTAGARSWVSLPAASTTTPAALGIAAVGAGTTWARADHIHAMPTASQVGAEPALGSPSTSGYLLSSTSAGARSWAAPYSLPTATASVLGGVKVGTGLAIASGVLSVAYGTAAGTACVGNDSRLSDSRTPTAHALDGALHTISGKTAGQVLVATGATTFGFATISGDATLSGAGALTLATLLTAGSAGSATAVPTLTWDAKGRLTAVGSAAISIPHSQINDWSTATSSFLTANQSISLTGAVIGSGATSITTSFANTHLASINQDLATTSSPTFATVTANLTGTASNASALGGVASDYFVQGTGYNSLSTYGKRTTSFNYNNAGPSSTALTDPLYTGFYDGAFTAGQTPNNSWAFVINTTHSNTDAVNKFQFQIAAGFGNNLNATRWGPENYWVRVINNVGVGDWRTLIHSGNYPSYNNFTSGLTTTTLTASGLITANGGLQTTTYADLGSATYPWGIVHANVISNAPPADGSYFDLRNTTLTLYKYVSQGITFTSKIEGTGRGLLLSSTAISGTFTPSILTPSDTVTIDANYQGKMVSTGRQVNFPTTGPFVGFWFYLSWYHDAYQGWGPTGAWILRGVSTTGTVTEKFSGIVSWTGSEWVAG